MHSFGHVVSRWFVAGMVLMLLMLGIACSPIARAQDRTDRSDELQQLVDALGDQIEMQRSFNRARAEASQSQLQRAIKAWQKASRSDDDFELMREWLEQSIQASLAGSRKPMPPLPTFSRPEVAKATTPSPSSSAPTPPSAPATAARVRVTEELPVAAEPPTTNPPVAATQPNRSPERSPTTDEAAPANPWARHPAATPVLLGDPFVDDPLPQQPATAPAVRTTPEPTIEPISVEPPDAVDPLQNARVVLRPTSNETSRDDAVGINLAALAARIRGHDRGLRGIEARLIANPDLRVEELLLLAKELETLAQQRKLIELYVDALNPAERARVTSPESAEALKKLIGDRAKRFRPVSQSDDQVDDIFSEQPSPALEEIETLLKSI